jgi:sugar O-acyltransferase (sialic acid O-acetyltransferase NeuD family)
MNTGTPCPLLVLGTRLLAEELCDLIADMPQWQLVGFVENLERERCRETLCGRPVLWIDEIAQLSSTHHLICGISTPLRWKFVEQVQKYGVPFATLVHPLARLSASSSLGPGSILSPGALVASHTRIGSHVFINRGVLIGHHTAIEDYVSVHPGANIAGVCSIGQGTVIGMGAIVIDHVKIGRNCMVAAGAVVTKDLADDSRVAGVPARSMGKAASDAVG